MPKRRWARVLVVAAAVVLVPYLFSRIAAPTRRISVFADSDVVQRSAAGKETIRVACYNIAHGRGVADSNWSGGTLDERMDRLDKIGELLKRIDADVVVLNEVDFDSSWSHSVNQAEYLAKIAGYDFRVEQRNLDFRVLWWKWRFGNAILSKAPISNAYVVDFPGYKWWETLLAGKKRGVKCEVTFNGSHHVIVGCHLSHRSESLRVQSAQFLVDDIRGGFDPLFIAGDMNSTPSGFPKHNVDKQERNAIEVFDRSGLFVRNPATAPPEETSLTFPSTNPQMVIDWILISNDYSFQDYRVLKSDLSDHLPIYADVLVKPNREDSGVSPPASEVD